MHPRLMIVLYSKLFPHGDPSTKHPSFLPAFLHPPPTTFGLTLNSSLGSRLLPDHLLATQLEVLCMALRPLQKPQAASDFWCSTLNSAAEEQGFSLPPHTCQRCGLPCVKRWSREILHRTGVLRKNYPELELDSLTFKNSLFSLGRGP